MKEPTVREKKAACNFRKTEVQCCFTCAYRRCFDRCTKSHFVLLARADATVCDHWKLRK